MERIEITITGELPEDDKFAVLASAQKAARDLAAELSNGHGLSLSVSVKSIRPSKKASYRAALKAVAAE